MMRKKYSVIIMMIALFGGQTVLAQKAGRVKKQKTKAQTEVVTAVVQEEQPAVPVKVIPETPPVPQDRLDTLYYNKSWKVTPNKAFANYYRLENYNYSGSWNEQDAKYSITTNARIALLADNKYVDIKI